MDRFVIRAPTWKTMNYSSISAPKTSTLGGKKTASAQPPQLDNKKKPLQQKQQSEIPQTYDFDKRMDDFFRPNAENFNGNSNDSGLSSASSISPHQLDEIVPRCNGSPSKNFMTPTKKNLGKSGDYVHCPKEKENDTCNTVTHTPKSHNNKVLEVVKNFDNTKESNKNSSPKPFGTPEKALPATSNMIMARIQRDLNSPSAAVRVRALKAMKSPTKSAYSHFDISETEKSLYFPEPPSLQEIMRNIVVYVEVRSGEDNRSAGVRKVIEALGARVNSSLTRGTTHVVFKDGLLSTFKKATQMDIPVVSILWIEACKNQGRICDPKNYPISNLDRYENPELYTKMKRVKSMQPDSECNKRVRPKAAGGGTPKDTTPTQKTAGAIKKTSTLIGGTPTSSTSKKKTDITQFFKKMEKPTPTAATGGGDGETTIPESPATQLLNRINSECYTPLEAMKKTTMTNDKSNVEIYDEESLEGFTHVGGNSPKPRHSVKKALDFLQTEVTPNVTTRRRRSSVATQPQAIVEIDASLRVNMQLVSPSPVKKGRAAQRRHSLLTTGEIETTTTSMNIMAISNTPSRTNRRRSSIHTPRDITMGTPSKVNIQPPIVEEDSELMETERKLENPIATTKTPRSVNKRRTLYAVQAMDQTDVMKLVNPSVEKSITKSTRRRTIFDCNTMVESSEIREDGNSTSKVTNRRRTCYSHKSIEQTTIEEVETTNKGKDGKTSPPLAKDSKQTKNRRRTLYTPQKINDEKMNSSKTTSPPNISNGTCVTPINFPHGKIACSTLLEKTASETKLVATPPADATIGKLLEETNQCVTPLMFSSTRQPGNKRRTLFDVSMDIITQRLQCINQSARRSLAPPPPTPSLDEPNNNNAAGDEQSVNTPINMKQLENNLNHTPQPSVNGVTEIIHQDSNSVTTPEVSTLKKKRKLFMPNEMLLTPPPQVVANAAKSSEGDKLTTPTTSTSSATTSVTKRRRTLMPISQPQPTIVTLKDSGIDTPGVRKRRSTLDFEQIKNIQTKMDKNKKINVATTSDSTSKSTKDSSTVNGDVVKPKKMPVLVYTNMHQQQIDAIREAIDKLGIFTLESCVTDSTTHLVSLEPRRTLNLLKALARGLWILEYSWLLESMKVGKWMPEESYELQDFSRSIEICRSERQAFGEHYKCELFRKFGYFYVSSQCSPITKENICELIRLCGGRVVPNRQKARYIIGDANRNLEDKYYLTPYWILDSITQMQIMKINSKYMYPLSGEKPLTQQMHFEKKQ